MTFPAALTAHAPENSYSDPNGPERNTKQLAEKLRAAGVPVTLRIYSRASHFTLIGAFARPLRTLEPVLGDVVAFVRGDGAAQ